MRNTWYYKHRLTWKVHRHWRAGTWIKHPTWSPAALQLHTTRERCLPHLSESLQWWPSHRTMTGQTGSRPAPAAERRSITSMKFHLLSVIQKYDCKVWLQHVCWLRISRISSLIKKNVLMLKNFCYLYLIVCFFLLFFSAKFYLSALCSILKIYYYCRIVSTIFEKVNKQSHDF